MADARVAALQLLAHQPDDLYNRRAVAWVYLDSIKKDSLNLQEALPHVEALLVLGLDASETILWEQLYWQVAKLLFRVSHLPDDSQLRRLRDALGSWPQLPGQAYGVLLKALLKQACSWPDLPGWIAAWNLDNLREVDFEAEVLPDGKTANSLAERAYLAVAKAYLNLPSPDPAIDQFLDKLDRVSEAHPGLLYLVYYRALLWQKRGDTAYALALFLPFARKKQRDFWVWDLLGQLHAPDVRIQAACFAKALSCRTKPEFLVKIRQKMAALMIQTDHWTEARMEIDALCATRTAHQWRIPQEVAQWMATEKYERAASMPPDDCYYTSLVPVAENLLKGYDRGVLAVVWAVNPQKQTVQFVVNEQMHGGFGYARFGLLPSPGDCLLLDLEKKDDSAGGYWKVHHAECTTRRAPAELTRRVAGPLKSLGNLGFVQDVYIEAGLLAGLVDQCFCQVAAVKAFNAKKNSWGWRAYRVTQALGNGQ